MGSEQVEIRVVASVSRHNSDKDAMHDSMWEELCERIEMIAYEKRYSELGVVVV